MNDNSTGWVRFDWPLTGRRFEASLAKGYQLRAAHIDDLDAMLAVVAAAYASDPRWEGLTADIERRVGGRIRERFADATAHFLLATHGRQIVGLNGVALASPTKMNLITGICVDPPHQGRGLGAALLGRSLAWLRDQGLAIATVSTDEKAAAARVYARFGAIRTPGAAFPDPPRRD